MSDDPLEPPRTPQEPPRIDALTGDTATGGLTPGNDPVRRFQPSQSDTDDTDDTPALACTDCEAVWVDPGENWAYCPRCGAECETWEVADE
jgi:hypothetical protein